jgi:hypothetical protein
MEYKAKESSPMNPILTFGLFALLIITGAALLLYGLLQRPGRKMPDDENCTIVIDDRLKPIVLDFQESAEPVSECIVDQKPEEAISPMETPTKEDHHDSTAADAISRLNEKFREMKELEAEQKKKNQPGTEPELQTVEADPTPPEEPEGLRIEPCVLGEKKTLPELAKQPDKAEQPGVSEQKGA